MITIGVVTAIVLGAALLFGSAGSVIASAASLLWGVWRHDNALGACLPLAVLFLVAVGMLILLMYLLAISR